MFSNFQILASAGGDANATGQLISTIGMIVVFAAVFYFLIYRPQKKQEKEVNNMRNNLQIGDEISTNGGILGRVVKIKDDIVTIETGSDKNKLKIFKWAVRAIEIPANSEENDGE